MTTLSAKEVAARFDTTPRTLRKFLRSDMRSQGGTIGPNDSNAPHTPGKGARYAIEAKEVKALKGRFDAWVARNAAKGDDGDGDAETTE